MLEIRQLGNNVRKHLKGKGEEKRSPKTMNVFSP